MNYRRALQPFKYIDPWKTAKGKSRTWLGHMRALAKIKGWPLERIKRALNSERTT